MVSSPRITYRQTNSQNRTVFYQAPLPLSRIFRPSRVRAPANSPLLIRKPRKIEKTSGFSTNSAKKRRKRSKRGTNSAREIAGIVLDLSHGVNTNLNQNRNPMRGPEGAKRQAFRPGANFIIFFRKKTQHLYDERP